MPSLLILLPDTPTDNTAALEWVLAGDGGQPLRQGRDAAADLPGADTLVLVLGARAVSWLRVTLPRAAAKRWRAALSGLLEEQLLDDPDHLHMALPPKPAAGEPTWVAVTALAPLQQVHAALAAANRFVDRIAPQAWPTETAPPMAPAHPAALANPAAPAGDFQRSSWWQERGTRAPSTPGPQGHFTEQAGQTFLEWRDADGVAVLPLAGGYAKARLPAEAQGLAAWSAEPAAVAAAEAWAAESVPVRTRHAHALRALESPWDLRQFELAPRLHGLRRVHQAWRGFLQPEHRSLRRGLIALVALQFLGLNALALKQRQTESARQAAVEQLFRTGFPNNQAPQDAAAQLPRELGRLRATAGQAGAGDLDPMLATVARHWPAGVAPLQSVEYQTNRLTLAAADWRDEQVEPFRMDLANSRLRVTRDGARLIVEPLAP